MTEPTTGAGTTALLCAPLLVPFAVAALGVVFGWRRPVAWGHVAAALSILAVGVAAGVRTADGEALAVGDQLRVDALSAVMLVVIGAVATVATWSGSTFQNDELALGRATPRSAQRFAFLLPIFLAAMASAVMAANLGLMWAAIEATTVATAFLVGQNRNRAGLEATWKYVVICSVGIALAYLGTVLVYFASRHSGAGEGSLNWATLAADAENLDPAVMRIAFALIVIGFGTKAGLIPLHSWLPDAHGQAPAPVSALMSGVLLPVAIYALVRHRVLVGAVDPEFARNLLLVVGLGSAALAASLLLVQRDYKRMLAYSSMEHMGLVAVGVAVGTPLALAAVLLHLLGHGLGKAVLFCGAGQLLQVNGSAKIADLRALLVRTPALGLVTALGLAALLGLPPFSLFASEIALARAVALSGHEWVLAPIGLVLLVAFAAIGIRASAMLLGPDDPAPAPAGTVRLRAGSRVAAAPLVVGLIALAAIGVVTWPLDDLLTTAAAIGAGS
ncbi:hydrogenase HycQ [Sporichthya brevicatena]|uniref:Hydrogenase HycQ n=1 Tax=Sporichthya brevicatena TaxID=171442 RepID=A0ABN1H0T0_9ACTN